MKKYNKLVRDLIPNIIRQNGSVPVTHIAADEEYRIKLYEKLREEVVEVIEKPSVEELADLQEVFFAICTLEGWSLDQIERVRVSKRKERGAFSDRVILDSTS